MHDLDVRDVMAEVVRAVRLSSRFDRVQRLAHRAFRERVEVHLESLAIQAGDVGLQQLGVDERQAAVVGGLAGLVRGTARERPR